ncbi:hypothetical protein ACWGNN_00675 [Streptomyces sp. NPDC055817]
MTVDPERYRLAADSLNGVATIAILCATCHEADENAEPVKVFDFTYPSIADVQAAAEGHEAATHPAGRE